MTDTQILLALINQAKANGFDNDTYLAIVTDLMEQRTLPPRAILGVLLMNHEFTKAAWGEKSLPRGEIETDAEFYLPAYKVHLQRIVIADDPIKYLADHL